LKKDQFEHITDNELLTNFYADRDNEWLGILLHRYTLLLYGVSMKYLKNEDDAKDSVQQVFLKAINELHKYKVVYFKSWIYMIAKNHCLMKLRNRGKFNNEINERLLQSPDETENNNKFLKKEEAYDRLTSALKELKTEQQQCVTLFYLQKKSYAEIVKETGYTLLEVKSNIQNGKRNLKNKLDDLYKDER
jgi:RNA polymerase sigma factor (sigma-70 family)